MCVKPDSPPIDSDFSMKEGNDEYRVLRRAGEGLAPLVVSEVVYC